MSCPVARFTVWTIIPNFPVYYPTLFSCTITYSAFSGLVMSVYNFTALS